MNVAAEILDRFIAGGFLKQEVDVWMDSTRNAKSSFYAKTTMERGKEAAEKELEEVVKKRFLREFANAIEPIVRGVKAIIEASEKGGMIFETRKALRYPVPHEMRGGGRGIVVYNPEYEGFGTVPRGSWVWGSNGTLGLEAIVVWSQESETSLIGASVDLVFQSKRNTSDMGGGRIILSLQRDGHVLGKCITVALNERGCLHGALGIASEEDLLDWTSVVGGDIEERFGFPGAQEYLARHIVNLAPYLIEAAKKLSQKNTDM